MAEVKKGVATPLWACMACSRVKFILNSCGRLSDNADFIYI